MSPVPTLASAAVQATRAYRRALDDHKAGRATPNDVLLARTAMRRAVQAWRLARESEDPKPPKPAPRREPMSEDARSWLGWLLAFHKANDYASKGAVNHG